LPPRSQSCARAGRGAERSVRLGDSLHGLALMAGVALPTTGFLYAAVLESRAFEGILSELRTVHALPSRDLPLIVVSRGRWGPGVAGLSEAENEQAWYTWDPPGRTRGSIFTRQAHCRGPERP
jgi:hypothetical protein